jgi:hypothetical protein
MSFVSQTLFVALTAVSFVVAQPATAQRFTLSLNGKTAGSAQMSEKQTGSGTETSATGSVKVEGLSLSFSRTSQLDKKSELVNSHLSGVVNAQAVTVDVETRPDTSTGNGNIHLTVSANGQKSNNDLDYHPHTVLLTDFDPSGLQTLLDVADQNGYRGIWVLSPKQQGQVYAAKIATLADEKGTLDGRRIKVHHLQLIYNDLFVDLFLSDNLELLQAESVAEAYAIVRNGFVLTPGTKPGHAPAQTHTGQQPDN